MLWCPPLTGCIASTDVAAVEEVAGTWLASNAIYSEIARAGGGLGTPIWRTLGAGAEFRL